MRLKPKVKRKRSLNQRRLDFITALTPEECWSRLAKTFASASDDKEFFRFKPDHFSLDQHGRLPISIVSIQTDTNFEMKFEGTLHAIQDRTWVRGQTMSRPGPQSSLDLAGLLLLLLVSGFFAYILLSEALGHRLANIALPLLILGITVGLPFERRRPHIAKERQLLSWIQNQIFIPSPITDDTAFEDIFPVVDDGDTADATPDRWLDDAVVITVIRAALFLIALLLAVDALR